MITDSARQAFLFHRDDLDAGELRSAYSASVQAFRSANRPGSASGSKPLTGQSTR
jgi:hypothetical protein